jgi:signal transduction histidine kinase
MTAAAYLEIQGLWRYPELAVQARWSGRVDDRARARLIARGIADRYTPESAVRYLTAEGEFDVAEAMLEEIVRLGLVDAQGAALLSGQIRAERRSARAQVTVQAHLLRERAERIELAEIDVAMTIADAGRRRAAAETRLTELDDRIERAETEYGSALERELDAALGDDPSAVAQAWGEQVRALLAVKEFPAARQVLQEGPGQSSVLPVDEPTAAWPWKTAALDEILSWFRSRNQAPRDLRDYVTDAAAERLLQAMRQLTESGEAAHGALAEALQELIGAEGLVPHLEPSPAGGHEFLLLIPDEFRLPPMSFAGRGRGLRVTIASREPTGTDGGVVVWLSTRVREQRDPGPVILDLSDLLSLMQTEKKQSGRPRSSSSRRMGLVRMICQQLPVLTVLSSDAFRGTSRTDLRHQVWWVLHAFGVSPDGVAVDTLLDESGWHPAVLLQALSFVVDYAHRNGFARLEPETFAELRGSESYRCAVQADLLAELGDAAAAALFTMIFFISVDDLPAALDTIAADARLEAPLNQLLDIAAVTARLRQAGYLTEAVGAVTLRESGITRLLRRGDPHEVAKQALERLDQARKVAGPGSLEAQLQEAQFQRRLAEIRVHLEMTRARMAEEKHREPQDETPAETRILDDRYLREERQQVEIWRNERVDIDLRKACKDIVKEVESFSDQVDINMRADRSAFILGSRMALRIALENILFNAQQAVQENRPPGERDIFVTISAPADDPAHVLVDVEDNGPGVPPKIRERLALGTAPPSSRHEGGGEGMIGAMVLLHLLGGRLEVLPDPSPALGGAHVRLRIPLARTA